jgi:hypothetical protein
MSSIEYYRRLAKAYRDVSEVERPSLTGNGPKEYYETQADKFDAAVNEMEKA